MSRIKWSRRIGKCFDLRPVEPRETSPSTVRALTRVMDDIERRFSPRARYSSDHGDEVSQD
ncbi:MAG: hypothetical protein GY716_23135 [bacterium]|nr:hypothetical protein [bacterium]